MSVNLQQPGSVNPKPLGDPRPAAIFPPAEAAFLSGGGAAPGAALGTAPPAVPFLSESQREAAAVIRSALAKRSVFAALTGEAGLGKTLLLDAVVAQPGMPVRVFRLGSPSGVSTAQVAQIERAMAQPAPGQRHTALFVDDAHAASGELLGFLARLAAGGRAAPQVILAGRPELWDRLAAPDLAPLLERIVLRPVLRPLTDADARGLVRHLLDQPRRSGQVLSAEAEAEVVRFSAGQPERIGQILGGTLMLDDVKARPPIPAGVVRSAAIMLAGRSQQMRTRRTGAWVVGVALLAAGGAMAVRGWPAALHDWPPAVRGWPMERVLATLGLTVSRTPARPDDNPAPQALPASASLPAPDPPAAPAMPEPAAAALAGVPPTADMVPNPTEAPSGLAASSLAVPNLAPPNLTPSSLAPPNLASPTLAPFTLAPANLASPNPAASSLTSPGPRLPAEATAAPLSPSTVAMLLRQGDERLTRGDISAARRLYERAASAGSAAGARGVARTYDPAVLGRAGLVADPAAAATWQGVAAALGEAEVRREPR